MSFHIDTDSVRGMATSFSRVASAFTAHYASIVTAVESADWQSQAREEYLIQLKSMQQSMNQTAEVLTLLGRAATEKADRWEWLASRFNAARQAASALWGSVLSAVDSLLNFDLLNLIRSKIPSILTYISDTGIGFLSPSLILGGLAAISPGWKWEKPSWWPFDKDGENKVGTGGNSGSTEKSAENGSGEKNKGESQPSTDAEPAVENEATPPQPTQPAYVGKYDGNQPAPGMNSSYGKPGQWQLDAPVKSNRDTRSPDLYNDVINQFGVGNNQRYARTDDYTFCNTFAGDVARAMGAPLPKKSEFGMNPKDQATIGFPQLYQFFTDSNAPVKAQDFGWKELSSTSLGQLENHVNQGKLAIVVNNGHIAVVRPGQAINSFNDIIIAQAGATNSNSLTLGAGFGSSPTPKIFIIE